MKGSLYSVSDKAMFDAINQSKVTVPELKDIFLSRGIIISSDTKREKLAEVFSMFTHGYFDYKKLSDILGTNTRREKNTNTVISKEVDNATVEAALDKLANTIERQGAKCEIEASKGGNSYFLKVDYHEFNYSNSEFKQVTKKKANIIIEKQNNELVIRHPQNKTVDEWKALLISEMERELEEELPAANINLSHIDSATKVTEFFTYLVNNMAGFTLIDVTDVYVYHPKGNAEEDQEDDEDSTLGTHISKAALKGQNVLRADVLKEFYEKDFYISKVVWRAKADGTIDEDIYEFEVQFSDAENKDNFSYLAKGFYSYISDGHYSKNRKFLDSIQERNMNVLIEKTARESIAKIME